MRILEDINCHHWVTIFSFGLSAKVFLSRKLIIMSLWFRVIPVQPAFEEEFHSMISSQTRHSC